MRTTLCCWKFFCVRIHLISRLFRGWTAFFALHSMLNIDLFESQRTQYLRFLSFAMCVCCLVLCACECCYRFSLVATLFVNSFGLFAMLDEVEVQWRELEPTEFEPSKTKTTCTYTHAHKHERVYIGRPTDRPTDWTLNTLTMTCMYTTHTHTHE